MTRQTVSKITWPMLAGMAGAIVSAAATLWATAAGAEGRLSRIESRIGVTEKWSADHVAEAATRAQRNDDAHQAIVVLLNKIDKRQAIILAKLGFDLSKLPE